MRISSVEMIGGDPIELGIEVICHLRHQVADKCSEVLQARPIFGRNQHAKLMPIEARTIKKRLKARVIAGRIVGTATFAVAADAVTHDVVKMGAARAEMAGDPRVARADDDPAPLGGYQAGRRANTRT